MELLPAVDAVLSDFLAARRAELSAMDSRLAPAADLIAEFLAGGKRIRPGFCWWGWRAGGGRDRVEDCAPVVRVAAALELIQACALLHDDLIDRSETRRGRPAVHRAQAKRHADAGWSGDSDHFGSTMALLFGDLALAWADDLFVTGAAALRAVERSQPVWHAMRTEVLAGQLLDVLTSAAPAAEPQQQRTDAFAVIRLKTAGYTVVRPLLLGAALAGAGPEVTDRLRRYGDAVGVAFQLRDDLLGVFGDPSVTGKPAGDDLAEGKRTVLLALAREELAQTGRHAELAELDAGIGAGFGADAPQSPAGPATVDRMRTIVASTGAGDAIDQQILELVAQGTAELDGLPELVTEGLTGLATAATRRRS